MFPQPGVNKIPRHIEIEGCHGHRNPEGQRRAHQIQLPAESLSLAPRPPADRPAQERGETLSTPYKTASQPNVEKEQSGQPDQRQPDAAPHKRFVSNRVPC
jgi:hypothetical protein